MSLQPGTYIIKSIHGALIGRHLAEDKSYNPKKILLLPNDFPEVPKWEITKCSDDTYILRTRGSQVSDIDGCLFAVLLPEPRPTEWKIVAQPHYGKNIYIIVVAHDADGWICPAQELEQIIVRPLVVTPIDPPQYPSNELFEITLID